MLFGKRKKEGAKLANIEFPTYEGSGIPRLERQVLEPLPKIQIPTRIKIPERPKIISPQRMQRIDMNSNKPLFIKIERYKEAMQIIDNIRSKISEAEDVLRELSRIRREEDKELDAWHNDINRIKSQLLEIDQKLFEV